MLDGNVENRGLLRQSRDRKGCSGRKGLYEKILEVHACILLVHPFTAVRNFWFGRIVNQAVLWSNGDRFPVMLNARKIDKILSQDQEQDLASILGIKPKSPIAKTPDPDGMLDDTHCVMTSKTHLNALADVFDLGSIYSIGDFTLYLGEWLMTWTPFVWGYAVIKKAYDNEQ